MEKPADGFYEVPATSEAAEVLPQPDEAAAGLAPEIAPPKGWGRTFRALTHRNYRVFATGQAISLIGTWMQNLSQMWLVYRLTRSEFLVSAVGFCSHVPVLLLGPLAGTAADRYSRYRIVLLAQVSFLAQALVLAGLTLSGRISPAHVFVLAALWGVINAFEIPARQSLFIHMVGKQDLINAISLNSVLFNTARVAGPAIAGLLIAALGEGTCFLLNAATFMAVIISLLMLRLPSMERSIPSSPWAHLTEGIRFVQEHRSLRSLLITSGITNIFRAPVVTLAPFFADGIFHRGSKGLGILTGAAGLGAVAGTLGLARMTDTAGLPRIILMSVLTTGLCLMLFAWSPSFPFSLVVYGLAGFSQMRQNAATNTLIQSLIPDDYRGRIMALFSVTVVGVMPIGHIAGGAVAENVGARWTVFLAGLMCLLGAWHYRHSLAEIQRAVRGRERQ